MPIPIRDILNTIRLSKPYFKKQTVESFINRRISESLLFQSLDPVSNNLYRITCKAKNTLIPLVLFKVDISEHPEFKTMDNDEEIHIEGKISHIDEISIDLVEVRVGATDSQQGKKSITNITNSIVNLGSGSQNMDHSKINFGSEVHNSEIITANNTKLNEWHEKPLGILALTITGGLILAALSKYFGLI